MNLTGKAAAVIAAALLLASCATAPAPCGISVAGDSMPAAVAVSLSDPEWEAMSLAVPGVPAAPAAPGKESAEPAAGKPGEEAPAMPAAEPAGTAPGEGPAPDAPEEEDAPAPLAAGFIGIAAFMPEAPAEAPAAVPDEEDRQGEATAGGEGAAARMLPAFAAPALQELFGGLFRTEREDASPEAAPWDAGGILEEAQEDIAEEPEPDASSGFAYSDASAIAAPVQEWLPEPAPAPADDPRFIDDLAASRKVSAGTPGFLAGALGALRKWWLPAAGAIALLLMGIAAARSSKRTRARSEKEVRDQQAMLMPEAGRASCVKLGEDEPPPERAAPAPPPEEPAPSSLPPMAPLEGGAAEYREGRQPLPMAEAESDEAAFIAESLISGYADSTGAVRLV